MAYEGYSNYGRSAGRRTRLESYLDRTKSAGDFGQPQGPRYLGNPTAPTAAPASTSAMGAQPDYARMAAGLPAQTQAAPPLGTMPTPSPGGGLPIMPRGGAGGKTDYLAGMAPEDQAVWKQFHDSIYAGPDWKGRHEAGQMLDQQLLALLAQQNAAPPIDFSGSSEISDQFESERNRTADRMAAQGFGGSGMALGADAYLSGQEGRARGSYYRQREDARSAQERAELNQFMQWARGILGGGLQRNYDEQDEPGFWSDLAGVAGGVLGAIPGVGGAIGGGLSALSGQSAPGQVQPAGNPYGDQFGTGTQNAGMDINSIPPELLQYLMSVG